MLESDYMLLSRWKAVSRLQRIATLINISLENLNISRKIFYLFLFFWQGECLQFHTSFISRNTIQRVQLWLHSFVCCFCLIAMVKLANLPVLQQNANVLLIQEWFHGETKAKYDNELLFLLSLDNCVINSFSMYNLILVNPVYGITNCEIDWIHIKLDKKAFNEKEMQLLCTHES